jgi:ribosomal protein S12 methylthiotransferase accessory factor YcaO
MEFSISKEDTKTKYSLEKIGTGAGVGWFSCVPEEKPGLHVCLGHLAARPFDRFMHHYALELVKELDQDKVERLIESGKKSGPHIMALIYEACILSEDFQRFLPRFKDEDLAGLARYSPDIKIPFALQGASEGRQYWLKCFSRNSIMHEALPSFGEAPFSPFYGREEISDWKRRNVHISQMPFVGAIKTNQTGIAPKTTRKDTGKVHTVLEGLGILEGWENRTEATLSPFALERPWKLRIHTENGRNRWRLKGIQNSYGRGLNIHQARMSYLMEIAERYAAFASVNGDQVLGYLSDFRLVHGTQKELGGQGIRTVDLNQIRLEVRDRNEGFYWMEGEEITEQGPEKTFVPAQLAFLFSNLDEVDLTSGLSSNGLGAGKTIEQARLSALLEVLERDGERIMPYTPDRCFTLETDEPKVHEMISDLKKKGIHIRFLDLTSELGVPCYKAFVEGPGGVILKGCDANLDGRRAVVSSMTEIPWPYPYWFGTVPSPEDTRSIRMEDLPCWSTGDTTRDLHNLEALLLANGYKPVYVDLTRRDTRIPVCRAIVPGLEMMTFFDRFTPLGLRQFAHYLDAVKD